MAQTTYATGNTGATITPKLYSLNMVLIATGTASESVADSSVFKCDFTEAPLLDGTYRMLMENASGLSVANWEVIFTGVDSEVTQAAEFTNNAQSGGDATEANQEAIIAAITPITTVYSPQLSSECLDLIRGDAYDGTSNNKLTWTTSKSVDTALDFNFTIRDSADAILFDKDTPGVTIVGSGTTITVSLTTEATDLFEPTEERCSFDLEVEFTATSKWTVARGNVNILKDESR